MQLINNRIEYNYILSQGFQPLILNEYFILNHGFRVDLQNEIFGRSFLNKGNVLQGNQRFYEFCWNNILGIEDDHICQNCMVELFDYSAKHVSHIISRANEPALAHDPRNVNILCVKCHSLWESHKQRVNMNIYILNCRIINTLKHEYQK